MHTNLKARRHGLNFLRLFGAHFYGQLVTVFSTLLTPIVFLEVYGATNFGVWVLFSSVAQAFVYYDFGLSSSYGNEVRINYIDDAGRALGLFFHILKKIFRNFIIFNFLNVFGAWCYAYSSGISLDWWYVGFFVILNAMFQPFINLLMGLERYYDSHDSAVLKSNTARLLDALVLVSSYLTHPSLFLVFLSIVVLKLLVIICWFLYLRSKYLSTVFVNEQVLSIQYKSISVGFMLSSISAVFSIQAPIYISSILFGPTFTGFVSLYRTISRVPSQAFQLLALATAPHITEWYRLKNISKIRLMLLFAFTSIWIGMIFWFFILIEFQNFIEINWFKNKFEMTSKYTLYFCLAAALSMTSSMISTVLASLNKIHVEKGLQMLFISVICAAFIFCMGSFANEGAFLAAVAVVESVNVAYLLFVLLAKNREIFE